MGQCFEVGSSLRIGEHDIPQRWAIEVSILGENGPSEPLDQSLEGRLTGLDYVPGHLIGVDDGDAQGAEEFGGRRFAAGDATGQANTEGSGAHERDVAVMYGARTGRCSRKSP